jgi:hypothetical protein
MLQSELQVLKPNVCISQHNYPWQMLHNLIEYHGVATAAHWCVLCLLN